MDESTIINLHSYCDVFGVPLVVLHIRDGAGQPVAIADAENHILDFFTMSEYLEIISTAGRMINSRRVINW